jgi:site-specific recombinase XerD
MRLTNAIQLQHITAPKTFRHTFATTLQDANVDPLIRNELMGHSPTSTVGSASGLGTTGLYTHRGPEIKRRQLEMALQCRPAIECASSWLARRGECDEGAGE